MASTESPREIVRVECDHSAGTGESSIYVCADGSRWQQRTRCETETGVSYGVRRGSLIHATSG